MSLLLKHPIWDIWLLILLILILKLMWLNGTVIAVIARKNKIVGTQERGRRRSCNSVINAALGLTVEWKRSLMR